MEEPIRILHVIRLMNHGGAESYIMNLYRGIDRTKVQFDFVETSEETGLYEKEILELGGRIYHGPNFNGKNILKYKKWWDIFFDKHGKEYRFVHGHIGSSAAIYLSSAKRHGIQTIAHSHNMYSDFSIKQSLYKMFSFPTRFTADFFFACSAEAAVSRYGKKVHYKVLNNAIDCSQYRYEGRKIYPFTEGKTVYGHIGRFRKQKNQPFVAEIFGEIYQRNPDSVLLFVGDGDSRQDLELTVHGTSYKDAVYFLGARDDIPELLQSMDVLLFPSFYEGLPVTMVEAQCSGLRCLISDSISDASILVPELITKMSLEQPAAEWAEKAISLRKYDRKSYEKEIAAAGFDIHNNAKWLEEFYLKETKKHE